MEELAGAVPEDGRAGSCFNNGNRTGVRELGHALAAGIRVAWERM